MVRKVLLLSILPVCAWAAGPSAADTARAVRDAGLDPEQCYRVRDLSLYKEDIRLYFNDGYLIFSKPVAGERIAAVFSADVEGGDGEILLLPPLRAERQSLARFTGSPNLDEHFRAAVLMFTDGSGRDLLESIEKQGFGRKAPEMAPLLAEQWAPVVSNILDSFAPRIAGDLLSPGRTDGFLLSALSGKTLGNFDVVYDPAATEQILAGQLMERNQRVVYDIWTSFVARRFRTAAGKPAEGGFTLTKFRIEASLDENLRLRATTRATVKIGSSPLRAFAFEISRAEQITAARIDGLPAELLTRESARSRALRADENEVFLVTSPELLAPASTHQMEFEHEGDLITSPGNGVYSVGARSNWYPRSGAAFADYELLFRYPQRLTLVTPGDIVADRTEGDWRITERRTPTAIRVAGFNLGAYEKSSITAAGLTVDVFGNRGLDPALQPPPRTTIVTQLIQPVARGPRRVETTTIVQNVPPPDPLARLKAVAIDVAACFQYFSGLFGAPPLKTLTVSPIPGTFGQGFPGLVYLSTVSYLDPQERPAATRNATLQTFFSDLMVAHEVAHQWWGNIVTGKSYQDEWLMEALAHYSALMWIEKKKGPKALEEVMADFQRDLLKTGEDGQNVEAAGPVTWGYRLEAAKSADAFRAITYEKGAWVLHMLRKRLGNDRFLKVLAELRRQYEFRGASTADLLELVKKSLPPGVSADSMESFFDNWVYSTGIPTLRLRYSVKASAKASVPSWKVSGTLEQSAVDENFSVDIPVEIQFAKGAPQTVWVRTSNEPSGFSATLKQLPLKVGIPAGSGVLAVRK
ncbi:MAG TPA: M1 family aminopeptidase [Bryobacteraceae bacterium]|nr:M1 family aminopeptidase [Bryobacteraceae bacterium]